MHLDSNVAIYQIRTKKPKVVNLLTSKMTSSLTASIVVARILRFPYINWITIDLTLPRLTSIILLIRDRK